MRIVYDANDWDVGYDVSTNPEIILMQQQGDDDECDIEESMWQAGSAVTTFKHND